MPRSTALSSALLVLCKCLSLSLATLHEAECSVILTKPAYHLGKFYPLIPSMILLWSPHPGIPRCGALPADSCIEPSALLPCNCHASSCPSCALFAQPQAPLLDFCPWLCPPSLCTCPALKSCPPFILCPALKYVMRQPMASCPALTLTPCFRLCSLPSSLSPISGSMLYPSLTLAVPPCLAQSVQSSRPTLCNPCPIRACAAISPALITLLAHTTTLLLLMQPDKPQHTHMHSLHWLTTLVYKPTCLLDASAAAGVDLQICLPVVHTAVPQAFT